MTNGAYLRTTGNISNGSGCITSADPRSLGSGYSVAGHYIIIAIHSAVIVTAVILNSAICHVYRKGFVRKSPFNILLVNLAVADTLTSLGMVPFIAVKPITLRQVSSEAANGLCTITDGLSVFWIGNATSIMTLTVISFNRYIIINHSMTLWERVLRRRDSTIAMIAFTWIFGFTLVMPNLISRRYDWCTTKCLREWPYWINGGVYALTVIVLGYLLPIGVMFSTLFASIRTLWYKQDSQGSDVGVLRSRKRVIVILCTLIGAFIFWWTPFAIYWILSAATDVLPDERSGYYIRARVVYIVTLFALLNAAVNPIIYGLKSDDFRHAIKNEFGIKIRTRTITGSIAMTPPFSAQRTP